MITNPKSKLFALLTLLVLTAIACGQQETPFPTSTPLPLSTLTPGPIPSQTTEPVNSQSGSIGIGDSYFPEMGNGGYDVQHYILDLSIDVEANTVESIVTIEAITTQPLSSFNLDFIGLTISSIEVNENPAAFSRDSGELTIRPAEPLPENAIFNVTIAYSGSPAEDLPQDVPDYAIGWHHYADGIYIAGEPSGSSSWYPVNEHPLDKAAYTFVVTVPQPYSVAANGILQETIENEDTITFIWESQHPIANYLVTIGIGEFELETQAGPNGLLIRNYFEKDIETATRRKFDLTADMIAFFNDSFGPYPFDAYGIVVHDLNLGFALETQTLSVFGKSFVNDDVIAHELAHQWFGDSVTLASWQDIWLNEGFASFASDLWIEHASGEEIALEQISQRYQGQAGNDRTYTLVKDDLINFLSDVNPNAAELPKSQVRDALSLILEGDPSAGNIDQVLADLPSESIPWESIPEIFDQFDFVQIDIPGTNWNQALIHLALGEYSDKIPIGNPTPNNLFNWSVYSRGALTLHALRARVGDDLFFEILQTYLDRFQYSNASTQDFITVAEEVSGQQLDDFFDGWLYQILLPDIPELGLFLKDF